MQPPSTHDDVDAACRHAAGAFTALGALPPEARAAILDAIAAALDARRDDILQTCAAETALTEGELTPEFARMTGTLRTFASVVRDGSWVRAAIDTPAAAWHGRPAHVPSPVSDASQQPTGGTPVPHSPRPAPPDLIGPNHDLRSLLIPLGPVAVFGSSNFPLAYGVCGGDTASALAAGCPVIVKEHPAHPKTGRMIAEIAQQAVEHALDEPDAQARAHSPVLQYIHNEDPKDFSVAQHLVHNEHIQAVGFTGSIPGGLAIEKLARERPIPIPVFAEMGSTNLVVVTIAAAEARHQEIAAQIAASISQRFGQQCTCPGLILPFPYNAGAVTPMLRELSTRLGEEPARRMLSSNVTSEFERRTHEASSVPGAQTLARGQGTPGSERATLLRTSLTALITNPRLQTEIFGPAAIFVDPDEPYTERFISSLRGMLVASVFHQPEDLDDPRFRQLIRAIASRAGRVAFNSPPTGVRVATAMVHGGPFPATNAPHTTAVGPRAIERWCRPICYQNCPDALLPPELQNANPRAIWRTINARPTRSPVS